MLLNSDMGEGLGLHEFGNDEELMRVIDVANVACGFHAGDPDVMNRTVALAAEHGVAVGSHPGSPTWWVSAAAGWCLALTRSSRSSCTKTGALTAFLGKHGLSLNHIKPHGALYGMLAGDEELMQAAAGAALQYGVPFYGLAGRPRKGVPGDGRGIRAGLYVTSTTVLQASC